jgi:hypothetical protein
MLPPLGCQHLLQECWALALLIARSFQPELLPPGRQPVHAGRCRSNLSQQAPAAPFLSPCLRSWVWFLWLWSPWENGKQDCEPYCKYVGTVIYTFCRGDHHQILRPLLGFHAGFGTSSCRTSSYSSGGHESRRPKVTSDSLATGYEPSSCSTHPSAGMPSSQWGCA